jgi:GT2 family glycosyltransferase
MNVILGIPTHIRHDLCRKCIDSALASEGIDIHLCYVIDNYGGFSHQDQRVRVINPPENLGVARSWNLLHKLTYPHQLIISNDDIIFHPWSIRATVDCPEPMILLAGWSCFLQREEVWQKLGEYDEGFICAYFEDNDYAKRMAVAGISEYYLPGNPVEHFGSATLNSLPEVHRQTMSRIFESNKKRYIDKWGGLPGQETYQTPFNLRETKCL